MSKNNEPFVIDFKQVFDNYMEANQKKWVHDRSTTVGASEAFNCMRQLVCEKRGKELGIEPDEDYVERWGATERGNIIENHFVVPAMEHLPAPLSAKFVGDAQHTHVLARNSATPDGLLINVPRDQPIIIKYGGDEFVIDQVPTGCLGLEIKSIDPRAHLDEERTKHAYQSNIGMGIIRETTKWRPEYWIILYVDAAWLDNIRPFVITYDPSVYKAAKRRAQAVWQFTDIKQAMPEGKLDGGCKYCRWKRACGEAIVMEHKSLNKDALSALQLTELDPLVVDAINKKEIAAAASEAYATAQERVKAWLSENKRAKATSENWSVSWTITEGRKALDKQAMKDDGIDPEQYMRKGASYETFRITPKT